MKSFFTPVASLLLLATLITTVLAQETITRYFGMGLPSFLAVYDEDGDNQLSPAEQLLMEESRNGLPQERVDTFDLDNDGVLSVEEALQARSQLDSHVYEVRSNHFTTVDTNGDAVLDFVEFLAISSVWDLFQLDSNSVANVFLNMQDPSGLVTLESFMFAVESSEDQPTTPVVDYNVEYPDIPDLFGVDEFVEDLVSGLPNPNDFIPDSILNLDLDGLTPGGLDGLTPDPGDLLGGLTPDPGDLLGGLLGGDAPAPEPDQGGLLGGLLGGGDAPAPEPDQGGLLGGLLGGGLVSPDPEPAPVDDFPDLGDLLDFLP